MILSDFRANHQSIDVPVEEPQAVVVMGPVTKTAEVVKETETFVGDDELDFVYDLEAEGLQTLKEVYDVMDLILSGLLLATVQMPIELVKKFEIAIGDMHSLINDLDEYKPEDAGIPCIAVTLEDEFRKDE